MQGIHTFMTPYPQLLTPIMATKGLSNKKPAHRRKDSGELDVFEAALYFSGGMDGVSFVGGVNPDRVVKEATVPIRSTTPSQTQRAHKLVKDKKCKKPSSPGSRLASFLNSFFKSKSITKSLKVEEESHGGRKRRSSIGHSQSIRSSDFMPIYSSRSCGFRTPPLYPNTSDRKLSSRLKSVTFCPQSEVWLGDKAMSSDGFSEQNGVLGNGSKFVKKGVGWSVGVVENRWVLNRGSDGFLKKDMIWVDDYELANKGRKSFRRSEDGASDCSSDLFELKIDERGCASTGFPVYGSTDTEVIKREDAIAGVAF